MKTTQLILFLPLVLSCGDNQECKQLREIKANYERAIASAKGRIALKAQSEKRMNEREAAAKKTKAELGLDLPESKLKEELDARVAKVPGATIERTTRQVSDVGETGGESGISETLWRIQFSENSDQKAFEQLRLLAVAPPLFKLVTFLKDEKGRWLLELMRASVVEVPVDVDPTPLPPPKDTSGIESQLGFCGAGALRDQIAKLDQQWLSLKPEAEALSVVMPKVATYESLQRRAQLLGEVERENRRLMFEYVDAVEKQHLRFRAIGVERAVVIYELYGGQKDKAKLERGLPEDVLKGMLELESAHKNVIRLSVVNRVSDEQIKRNGGGTFQQGVGLAPEKGR